MKQLDMVFPCFSYFQVPTCFVIFRVANPVLHLHSVHGLVIEKSFQTPNLLCFQWEWLKTIQTHIWIYIYNIQDYLRCWAFCMFFGGWLFACNSGMVCEIDPLWICLKCDMRYTPNPPLNHHVNHASYEFCFYLFILGWMKWLVACSNFRESLLFLFFICIKENPTACCDFFRRFI